MGAGNKSGRLLGHGTCDAHVSLLGTEGPKEVMKGAVSALMSDCQATSPLRNVHWCNPWRGEKRDSVNAIEEEEGEEEEEMGAGGQILGSVSW